MIRNPKVVAALLAFGAIACAKKKDDKIEIQTAVVERRNIVVSAQANGAIEPVSVVEVKSKASGVVIKMPVDIGSQVTPGALLVQIDARDVQNQYNQAAANLNSAKVSEQVAAAQLKRSRELFNQRIITAQENEAATLTYANATSAVVAARTNLDLARQRLEDATVRAPIAGTIISKTAQLGSVITSATSSASGGTTILTMADLTKVRMRAMVNETDIGNIHPGQVANVSVDAYPSRRFVGTVEKIEPQAVVQQSVTMFAVLISLPNLDAALMPGMNGEATMIVSQRENVLAVPNDAIRSTRELATVAPLLGLNPDSLRSIMQRQRSGGGGGGAGGAGGAVPTTAAGAIPVRGGGAGGGGPTSGAPGGFNRGGFGGGFNGDTSQAARAARRAAFAKAGGDTSAAGRAARRAQFGGGGGGFGGGGFGRGGAASSTPTGAGGAGAFGGGAGAFAGTAASRAVVFLKEGGKWVPKSIRTGVSDFDYTEVLNGLKEGDSVALLASAAMQAQRAQQQQRARAATGGGLQTQPTGGAAGGGGGGGGGRGPGG